MARRPYTMRKRAKSLQKTRQRIVEAAVGLHGSVGPRNTTISAVAKRAGVRRVTVYRHFPDDVALFAACSAHWMSQNLPPDPTAWEGIIDPERRSARAVSALYGWYSQTAPMLKRVYRDVGEVEALKEPVQAFERYLAVVREDLVSSWRPRGRKPKALVATVAHALAFSTWSSLRQQGLSDARARDLAVDWIALAAG